MRVLSVGERALDTSRGGGVISCVSKEERKEGRTAAGMHSAVMQGYLDQWVGSYVQYHGIFGCHAGLELASKVNE